jgi:hypothetical protein
VSDADAVVRMLLDVAGLAPSEEEIAALVASYPEHRARVEALYAVDAARYESPALIFDPTATVVDWNTPG